MSNSYESINSDCNELNKILSSIVKNQKEKLSISNSQLSTE